jgi:molecular chaperone GrpE (heat shock protein)
MAAETTALSSEYDEAVARLELEWAALGARTATVKSALRAVEETAFSEVATAMTQCVEELATAHVNVLDDIEARALALIDALS